jgi:hypothetical protein
VLRCRPVCAAAVRRTCPGVDYRRRQGFIRRRAAGCNRRSLQPSAHRKVRTAVTDESGRYRIVDLRPGTYTVNFTLTGFQSVRREGVELPGTFTATVDADLKVGSLEETITVTGDSPTVDVQSIRRQTVLDNEITSGGLGEAEGGGPAPTSCRRKAATSFAAASTRPA